METPPAQITELKEELVAAREQAHRLVASVGPEQWNRRPQEGRWSIAECLIHLNLTSRAYLPLIHGALDEARRQEILGNGPYRRDVLGWLLARGLEPPYRFRSRTAARFVPAAVDAAGPVMEEFDRLQGGLLESLDAAAGVQLDRVRIISPFSTSLKYNLYSTFRILSAHQRRHLWQAAEVKRVLGNRQ
jgi:DinB superfamily